MTDKLQQSSELDPGVARKVSVRTGSERYRTRIETRGHVLAADEPVEVGGRDLGPSPYDLLCAALGSCTTITAVMYADRKGWPLEEVNVVVTHQRVQVPGAVPMRMADHFAIEIEFTGELDVAQRARLVEIAGRCPVHRTLVAGALVETMGI